jgi:hypothetical protein
MSEQKRNAKADLEMCEKAVQVHPTRVDMGRAILVCEALPSWIDRAVTAEDALRECAEALEELLGPLYMGCAGVKEDWCGKGAVHCPEVLDECQYRKMFAALARAKEVLG